MLINRYNTDFLKILENFTLLPGGSDVNPAIYGKKNYMSHVNPVSDLLEMELFHKSVKQGKPIIGICKGSQMLAALNGLTLIQDMSHSYDHEVTLRDDNDEFTKKMLVNSTHHQCAWTENKLEDEHFKVYGYAKLSPYHHYQIDEKINCEFEPEIIWYPKVNALGIQSHPEIMDENKYAEFLKYITNLINKLF